MYAKMNTFVVTCLLAMGVMARSSGPMATSSEALQSYMVSLVPPTSHHVISTSTTSSDPPFMTTVMSNQTTPVWTYFNTTVTTVVVVQTLTTLCKEATTLTFNDHEYPATAGQVVVVTDCPCTVTTTIPTMTSSICSLSETVLPMPSHAPLTMSKPAPVPTTTAHVAPPIVPVGSASFVGSSNLKGLFVAIAAIALGF